MTTETLDLDELVEHWTLLDGDHELVARKRGTSPVDARATDARSRGAATPSDRPGWSERIRLRQPRRT